MLHTFDIFFGDFREKDALLVSSVKGFDEAYHTMLVLAAEKPGPYFVFDTNNKTCTATVDTAEHESDHIVSLPHTRHMRNTPMTARKPTKGRAGITTAPPDRSLSAAIHDRVGQSLLAIKMEIEKLKPRLRSDDSRALDEIGRLVDKAIAEVRTTATEA